MSVEESKEIEKKELEMCHLWIERDFSNIPTALLEKAYKDDWYDEIEILAPTFEDFKKEYREEHQCEIECEECTSEPCRDAYDDWYPKIPIWGWVFAPKDPIDREWIKENANKVAECGLSCMKPMRLACISVLTVQAMTSTRRTGYRCIGHED